MKWTTLEFQFWNLATRVRIRALATPWDVRNTRSPVKRAKEAAEPDGKSMSPDGTGEDQLSRTGPPQLPEWNSSKGSSGVELGEARRNSTGPREAELRREAGAEKDSEELSEDQWSSEKTEGFTSSMRM